MSSQSKIFSTPIVRADNSFGFVRYILALDVLVAHFAFLTDRTGCPHISTYEVVGGFFALSGFLIFKSYHHSTSTADYLRKRAWRIMPSYIAIVVACVLLLCPMSTLGIIDYFTNIQTWQYLVANLTFVNFVQPDLPGVFTDNIISAVNGSLWTMKVEWALYLSVPFAAWLILRKKCNPILVISLIYLVSASYRWWLLNIYFSTGVRMYEILSRQVLGQMTFFYSGVLFYCYYTRLERYFKVIAPVALIIYIFCVVYESVMPVTIYLTPFAFSALVIALGLAGRWGMIANKFENFSYEIYLFHFPVIQVLATFAWFNELSTSRSLLIVIASTCVLSYLCARYISDPLRHRAKNNNYKWISQR